jgi:hypothetical protein
MEMSVLRGSVIFGVPVLLGLLELGHPAFWVSDPVIDTLGPIAIWWTALHVAQVPLFALLGLAVVLLLRDLEGRAALVSRCASPFSSSFIPPSTLQSASPAASCSSTSARLTRPNARRLSRRFGRYSGVR